MAFTTPDATIEPSKDDLQYLLRKELGSDLVIDSFKTQHLTKPGDNYGSTILAVDVTYHNDKNKSPQTVFLVAKLMPPSEFLREAFNINVQFNKEVKSYAYVSPEHRKLQKELHIPENEILDVFPRFYGARTNELEDLTKPADDTAILLLENLKPSGYRVQDRRKGLDLKHVQLVVSTLAHFHAQTIALRIHKRQIFEETVLKACETFQLGSKFDSEGLISTTVKSVDAIPECKPYIKEIEDVIREALRVEFVLRPTPREPFATMLHNDFWLNNMLFKYGDTNDGEESPTSMKIVDFQIVMYDSPVRDLLFFLFTSCEDGLIEEHLDNLISLYHKEFIKHLSKLKCNTDEFSFEKLKEEFDIYAPREFSHILFLLKVVSAENTEAQSLSESDMGLFDTNGGEVYSRKVKSLVLTYVNRGWLRTPTVC